jgi:hypothetical protein
MTVPYPLGAPKITKNTLTVDVALQRPEYITRRIADLTAQKFIVDKIFASAGQSVKAGAVIYDRVTENDTFLSRDVEQRAPTDEYPVVYAPRGEQRTAEAEDWGGKFAVSDEAKSRNNWTYLSNQTDQLANTIVRKINSRAVAGLEEAIAEHAEDLTVTGHNWHTVQLEGATPTANTATPAADFAMVQLKAERDEMGIVYDLWLLNPQEDLALRQVYGKDYKTVLDAAGIDVFSSSRVAPNTAYAVATQQVGFLAYEVGLNTTTWRDEAHRQTWVQSFAMPIMGVTNPYAIRKVQGLSGGVVLP